VIQYPLMVDDLPTRALQGGLEGRTVVFVHGVGGRANRWAHNLDALGAQGYRAVAVDLPGHGQAAKGSAADVSVPRYTRFVADLVEQISAGPVTIVGTSLGGCVAGQYALAHRDRVEALVLVGSMGLVPLGPETRQRIHKGVLDQSREAVVNRLRRVIAAPTLVTDELIEEEYRNNNSFGAAESFAQLGAYIEQSLDDDVFIDGLSELSERIPLLLVWGREDGTVPLAAGIAARSRLPRAQLAVMDGAAHSPYLEKPLAFNELLLEFLATNRVQAPVAGVEYV
jgi:2-hydroxy-6-oxonona-2,4-dienedioate hydrolase